MPTTNDPQLKDAVKLMGYCCGPFARMSIQLRTFALNLLEIHNAAFDSDTNYSDCQYNRKVINLLASNLAEFVKRERLAEYEKEKGS